MLSNGMIRVIVAEDRGILSSALARQLAREPDIDVVAAVRAGTDAVDAALAQRPDVVLLDVDLDGMAAATHLRERLPGCRILVLTSFGSPEALRRAMAAGADAFLAKDGPADELADAVRRVLGAEPEREPAVEIAGPSPFTARERAVLDAVGAGAPLADVAEALSLSLTTVRDQLSSAVGKTGTRNRIEAARIARHNGWL